MFKREEGYYIDLRAGCPVIFREVLPATLFTA